MFKIPLLLITMVRWRAAVVLVLFLLIGGAWHGLVLSPNLLLAMVSIVMSYACATSANDLADFAIDMINLPADPSRPLVTKRATRGDLMGACVLAGLIALACGALIGWRAVVLLLVAALINVAYSLPPSKISHRPLLTPLFLPLGYVIIPYLLGVVAMGSSIGRAEVMFIAALYLLFVGRIILKDFRDRKGDAAHGKKTFLLTYGKGMTIVVSLGAIAAGYLLLITSMYLQVGGVSILLGIFGSAAAAMLWRLKQAEPGRPEQNAIGVGAKMGNGGLLTVLGLLILHSQAASIEMLWVLTLFFAVLYLSNMIMFLRHPHEVVIAYKA